MCQKLPYCARTIDPCIRDEITLIRWNHPELKMMLSCCGHNRYSKSLIVFNKKLNIVFEFFSGIVLSHGKRKSRKYYQKDMEGYYYIPELMKT